MCGRYASARSDEDLTNEFHVTDVVEPAPARSWNVAPTDAVRIVIERPPHGDRDAAPVRQLRTVAWGLVPSWSKSRSGAARMINARSETLASKPAFSAAAARRRCLVPSSGYFEWQNGGGRKVPYFLHAPDEATLPMAGLYEIWRNDPVPEQDPGAWVWTCTIITRQAADTLGHIHDRCPVLVPPDMHERWLDCRANDPKVAARLLGEMPEPHFVPRRVSFAVNKVQNDGPHLTEPIPDEPMPGKPLPGEPVPNARQPELF